MPKVIINGQEKYIDGYLLNACQEIKKLLESDRDVVCIIDGEVGCLSGDTIIRTNRASLGRKHTIKWMYNQLHGNPDQLPISNKWDIKIPTFIRSFDGKKIGLHKIKEVVYSGKKEVYELELVDGKKLKATSNHKIMTQNGFIELSNLDQEKDLVMCDTPHAKSQNKKRHKPRDLNIHNLIHHPFNKKGKNGVEIHRLIYEANINNLKLYAYFDILMNDKKKSQTLKFINPQEFHVHHKDGNHYNNSIDNLETLTPEDHLKKHAEYAYDNFNQGYPIFINIKSTKKIGVEDTYDLICDEPYHNFNANEIIVHNSGKSTIAQLVAAVVDPTFNESRLYFEDNETKQGIINSEKKKSHILDETLSMLNIRRAMSNVNITITSLFSEIRQKNLFLILCLPSIFDLDRNIAIHRSLFLIHTYSRNGQRGYFRFYGRKAKAKLFASSYAKKTYQYLARPTFWGRFANGYVVNEEEYRQRKDDVLKRYIPKDIPDKKLEEKTLKEREKKAIQIINLQKTQKLSFRKLEELGFGYRADLAKLVREFQGKLDGG